MIFVGTFDEFALFMPFVWSNVKHKSLSNKYQIIDHEYQYSIYATFEYGDDGAVLKQHSANV